MNIGADKKSLLTLTSRLNSVNQKDFSKINSNELKTQFANKKNDMPEKSNLNETALKADFAKTKELMTNKDKPKLNLSM